MPSEVTLVHLDLAPEGALVTDVFGDGLTKLVVVEDGGIAVDADEFGGSPGRGAGDEVLDEPSLGETWEFASSSDHGGD